MEQAKSIKRLPRALDVAGHPWRRCLPARAGTHARVVVLAQALYRCDPVLQQADTRELSQFFRKQKRKRDARSAA
eukprot:5381243-Alexandrium_andersonii.AAC.1